MDQKGKKEEDKVCVFMDQKMCVFVEHTKKKKRRDLRKILVHN